MFYRVIATFFATVFAMTLKPEFAFAEDDSPEKYAEHYDIGRNIGGGFFFDFRATPTIPSSNIRLHYENEAFGRYVFSGLHFDKIPFIGGNSNYSIFPGKIGMLHVLPLDIEAGPGRIYAGIGLGDRVRLLRGNSTLRSDVKLAEVWSPALGLMGQFNLALPGNLFLATSLEITVGAGGNVSYASGVVDEKIKSGDLRFEEVRGRLELQYGTVLSFGTLFDASTGSAKNNGPVADALGVSHQELTLFAGFRQPAIENSVASVFALFGKGESKEEKTHSFEGASTVQFTVLGGANFVHTNPAELAFAKEKAREITRSDDVNVKRYGVGKRPNLALWLSYFNPAHFYVGLGGHAILAQNEKDTRFIITSGRQERVIDISRMAIGAGAKVGAHTTLFSGHMLAYGGVAGGISNYRYQISTYSCGVSQVAQTEPSDLSFWCDGSKPNRLSNGSMRTGRWAQPHIGLIYSFETIGAEVETPGSSETIYVGGGFYLYTQAEWDIFFGDKVVGTDGKALKTDDGRKLPLGLSGGSILGGVGWAFRFGG